MLKRNPQTGVWYDDGTPDPHDLRNNQRRDSTPEHIQILAWFPFAVLRMFLVGMAAYFVAWACVGMIAAAGPTVIVIAVHGIIEAFALCTKLFGR